ncbi:MAG: LicD family protein [Lachnospiraceae bacterium]|nr:LicD family protein [Lachnospiraceae bacterium]
MLEFQEGFFNQEIRERFYLDTTMKTVWASEMELLQKVAEVCDKYGLTWYAAYGTLLGAIRHEGFVPWDDDLDIWLIRDDYNKLMEVLHEELPEGYRVRGPLANEEYDQFHTCVNNGSSISIEKEWLEQFHNCPFTVGIDIFPLDYLPRDEADREMQKKLFLLSGRIAQLARKLDRKEYDAEEGESEAKIQERIKNIKQEIKEGITYIEKTYHLSIDRRLFDEEKWYSLCSEMWKWANHIAMRYNEEKSDYLVQYVGYSKRESVKFPKEWFSEVYGATFENFMVPVPSGYDRILKRIYGSYWIHVKKTGAHEYPCYARQLRQLREYAGKNSEEESRKIPNEWLPIVTKKDGSKKKLILSANDPNMFALNGDRALDKLEQTIKVFEAKKDQITLWWRPHPVMKNVLDQLSTDLGGRYQQILDRYKSAGFGICDETDNTERAVTNCDAYYGDLNAILQPFQNAEKPIMIAHLDEEDTYHEQ